MSSVCNFYFVSMSGLLGDKKGLVAGDVVLRRGVVRGVNGLKWMVELLLATELVSLMVCCKVRFLNGPSDDFGFREEESSSLLIVKFSSGSEKFIFKLYRGSRRQFSERTLAISPLNVCDLRRLLNRLILLMIGAACLASRLV